MVKYRLPQRVFVGLDYHQSVIQVCVLDAQGHVLANRPCGNDCQEVVAIVRCHGDQAEVAIEACSGAADLAEELLEKSGGWAVHLAHPGYVARLKQSPDKSDFSDARLLADLVRVGYLPKVWLAPRRIRQLRTLVRYRQQLANERRSRKLRGSALMREHRQRTALRSWTKAWKHWALHETDLGEESRCVLHCHVRRVEELQREIALVERRLAEQTAQDACVQRMLELSGIGLVTAVTLRAEIGRFDRFRSGKQLARFCGLSPRNASSGARQADAGLIKAGNPELRRVLIEAAQRLKQYDDRWHDMNQRLKAHGKPASVATAAIANRWMRWLYHQMVNLSVETVC